MRPACAVSACVLSHHAQGHARSCVAVDADDAAAVLVAGPRDNSDGSAWDEGVVVEVVAAQLLGLSKLSHQLLLLLMLLMPIDACAFEPEGGFLDFLAALDGAGEPEQTTAVSSACAMGATCSSRNLISLA